MSMRLITILAAVLGGGTFWSSEMANAAEIKVLSSQAIKEAYLAFAPEFERVSGHKLNTTWNGTVDILKKLRAGEVFDMVILVTPSMETMIKEGKIVGATAASTWCAPAVAIAVPPGAPKPDISTDRRREARAARRQEGVGYSSGPSGVFLQDLFKRWGIADQIKQDQADAARHAGRHAARAAATSTSASSRSASSCSIRASNMSARCPRRCRHVSVFCGGVHTGAKQPDAARELINFIPSPAALPYIKKTGMEQGAS